MSKSAKTYRLDDSLLKELEVIANKRDISMTKFVEDAIRSAIHSDTDSNTECNTDSNTDDKTTSALIEQLDRKDRQIENQERHISDLTRALEQAQKLHGADILRLTTADNVDNVEDIETIEDTTDTVDNITDTVDITIVEDKQSKHPKRGRIREIIDYLFG